MGTKTENVVNVVTGVIADDIHVIGLRILEYALRKNGFNVVSLGPLASQREFVEAAIETDAAAIFVSSLNGHGEISLEGLREALEEAGRGDILIYAGGQLTIRKPQWSEVLRRFVEELRVDRVYPPETDPEQAIADLRQDLIARGKLPPSLDMGTRG